MSKLVAPDPAVIATREPQEIPPYGTFPMLLSESGRTEAEWRALIKAGAPLVVVDAAKCETPTLADKAKIAAAAFETAQPEPAAESDPDQVKETNSGV